MKKELTLKQRGIQKELGEQFKIDPERVLFLNDDKPEEAWLPPDALMTIARQSGDFQAIEEQHVHYIETLKQIIHTATVIDRSGRTYTRSGVATIGEQDGLDEHILAGGRAVSAALTAAGFNPLKPGTVVDLQFNLPEENTVAAQVDEARSRNQDLKTIHVIAERKGLIKPLDAALDKSLGGGVWDRTEYRKHLQQHYGVSSAAGFDQNQRASLIHSLGQLPDALVDEFAEVA